jgi:hypothetical protein
VSLLAGASLVVLFLAVAFTLARPWLTSWGATNEELKGAMPGDELVSQPYCQQTQAPTIDAPAEAVWPWVLHLEAALGGRRRCPAGSIDPDLSTTTHLCTIPLGCWPAAGDREGSPSTMREPMEAL